jgi:osmoprotectant transport system ATP-binding protein
VSTTDGSPVPPAIRLARVTKRYEDASAPAVAELDLDIGEGELVALVGPSGCGKTTILKMVNRLIEPSSGQVLLKGVDAATLPVHELRRGIGYVIQQAGLFPHRSVGRNIATVPTLLGWDRARTAARVAELAELVGLDAEMLPRYPSALSGGQQQRVGVARALAADPPVLLMDEPYSAVDPVVRARLQDELLALQRRLHKTILFVTHDIDEAIKLADRVAILNVGGVLEQYGTPEELLRAPASPFVEGFLGRDRALKRLSLLRVSDLPPSLLLPAAGANGAVVSADATLRDALDTLLGSPGGRARVLDGDGAEVGVVTVESISGSLR